MAVDIVPTPKMMIDPTPAAAVIVHASGSANGRFAHGHTSACANISNAMATSGGNKTSRSPVILLMQYVSSKKLTNTGSHAY
jgi:hypothetical protein